MDDYTKGLETLGDLIGGDEADKVKAGFKALSPAFEKGGSTSRPLLIPTPR